MQRCEVMRYLDDLLTPDEFEDYCVNGLQVEGTKNIEKICMGVTASLKLFKECARLEADMILVHHGLFWKGSKHPFALTGIMRSRIAELIRHDMNLVAYHLPLDSHIEVGHAARIASAIGLEDIERLDIGVMGKLKPGRISTLAERVGAAVGSNPLYFDFSGNEKVTRVAVITGGSASLAAAVAKAGAEAFVLGSMSESVVREAEELGLSMIAAGHYNTEKPGLEALCERLADDLGIETHFVDVPNPV